MYEAMNDDLNSPIVISNLFEYTTIINKLISGTETISAEDLELLKSTFALFMFDILGLKNEEVTTSGNDEVYGKVVDAMLELRNTAKQNKDWTTADFIRNTLSGLGFDVKDTKDGVEWKLNK